MLAIRGVEMTGQNELKRIRNASNTALTTISVQTGLKKEHIIASEDIEEEFDLAVFFILQDFYRRTQNIEMTTSIPAYSDWLASLKVGDRVIIREQTVGTTDTYIYSSDIIEKIDQQKIALKSKAEFNLKTGEVAYYSANGVDFHYKLFPSSNKINTSKKIAILQKAIELFTTSGIV